MSIKDVNIYKKIEYLVGFRIKDWIPEIISSQILSWTLPNNVAIAI